MSITDDPIEFELFKNALFAIADEMALTVFAHDLLGRAQGQHGLLDRVLRRRRQARGAGADAARAPRLDPDALDVVVAKYRDDMAPGDVFVINDPFEGGMHLPDIFAFKPLYHEGRRLAFAATICHHTDVGGRVAGSNASDSTEIYQEGLRIPPLKLYDAGRRNETLFALIEKNVRLPVRLFGDLRAQLAACHIAEQQFKRLVERYGAKQVPAYMAEVIDYTERLTRASLAELPDGSGASRTGSTTTASTTRSRSGCS